MIVHHDQYAKAYDVGHVWYWVGQPLSVMVMSATSATPIAPVIGPCDLVEFGVLTVALDTTADITVAEFGALTVLDREDCD